MIEKLKRELEELAEHQRLKMLRDAKRISPTVTEDDLWQPNDFPELENHPLFRYEEGVHHGILMALTTLNRLKPSPFPQTSE